MNHGESDRIIVLGDGSADHMGTGATERCSPHRKHDPDSKGRDFMPTSLRRIAERAKSHKAHHFGNLFGLLNEEYLRWCFYQLRKDAACGVDGITFAEYGNNLESNLQDLVLRLKAKRYHAKLVKRKYIPKVGSDKLRALGIPALEDKVVQMGAARVLEAIFEADFLPVSYGYRSGTGPQKAVRDLTRLLNTGKYGWVVEADIRGFFDNLDHDWLMRMLAQRISDTSFLRLIRKWLKAGILDTTGMVLDPLTGTPQGGIISPILANIYLHFVLDLWFEKVGKSKINGQALLMRYADDFVCAFQFYPEAHDFFQELPNRLQKFNLEVAAEKTRLLRFNRFQTKNSQTFDFLGFEFRWDVTRKGRPGVFKRTAKKKLKASFASFTQWAKKCLHRKVREWGKTLRAKFQGYWNYFGVRGNMKSLERFYFQCRQILFKWLNRRSARRSYTWKGFDDLLKHLRIPRPRITEKMGLVVGA